MALIPRTELKKGKTYRLVKDGESVGYLGLVIQVMSDHVSAYTPSNVHVRTLDTGVDRFYPVEMWWMYRGDLFEELSEEEALLYHMQGGIVSMPQSYIKFKTRHGFIVVSPERYDIAILVWVSAPNFMNIGPRLNMQNLKSLFPWEEITEEELTLYRMQ